MRTQVILKQFEQMEKDGVWKDVEPCSEQELQQEIDEIRQELYESHTR